MASHDLIETIRGGRDPAVRRRRTIAALAGFAAADFMVGALYQAGVIERVPDPPIPGFDSAAVMRSAAAYPLGVPDAPVAAAFSAGLMALAVARGSRATGRPPVADVALGMATLAGAAGAAFYMGEMVRQRRLCGYCIAAATTMFTMAPLAWPLLRSAWRELRHRSRVERGRG